MSLSPLADILRTELIEAAGPRFGLLPSEAVTPLGTEDRKPVLPLAYSLGAWHLPAHRTRFGGCGVLQDARKEVDVKPPSLCVVHDARAQGAHP